MMLKTYSFRYHKFALIAKLQNSIFRFIYLLYIKIEYIFRYGDITSNEPKVMNLNLCQTVLALYGILCFLPLFFSTGQFPFWA